VDYIAPQLYWDFDFAPAPYESLLEFWVNTVKYHPNVHLYLGKAAYRVGTSGAWTDATLLPRQMELSRSFDEVKGHIFFSIDSLIRNPLSLRDKLSNNLYQAYVQIPDMPWLDSQPSVYATNLE
jgi:uncharacterized lipoprotein YddW (UPF0748 family)